MSLIHVQKSQDQSIPRQKPWSHVRYVEANLEFSKAIEDNPVIVLLDQVPFATRLAPLYPNEQCPRNFFEQRFGSRYAVANYSRSGMLIAAVLHNGDILVWCTYSGECEILPSPFSQEKEIARHMSRPRTSVFRVPPKHDLNCLYVAISDNADSVLLMTRDNCLWMASTNLFLAKNAIFIDKNQKCEWFQIHQNLYASVPSVALFFNEHRLFGTVWCVSQLYFHRAGHDQNCTPLKAEKIKIRHALVSISDRKVSSFEGDVDIDGTTLSSTSDQIVYAYDSSLSTIALVANTSSPHDLHLKVVLTRDLKHEKRIALSPGLVGYQSSVQALGLEFLADNQTVCLLTSLIDILLIDIKGGQCMQILCSDLMTEPCYHLPVSFSTGPGPHMSVTSAIDSGPHIPVRQHIPVKFSLTCHPSQLRFLVSNGISFVEFVVGDVIKSGSQDGGLVQSQNSVVSVLAKASWSQQSKISLKDVLAAVEHFFEEGHDYHDIILTITELEYYLQRYQKEIAGPLSHARLELHPKLYRFWMTLSEGLRDVFPALSNYLRPNIYVESADSKPFDGVAELYLKHQYTDFEKALQALPIEKQVPAKFMLYIIRYDFTQALNFLQKHPSILSSYFVSILLPYFQFPESQHIRVLSPISSFCSGPTDDYVSISRAAANVAVKRLSPSLKSIWSYEGCIINSLRCHRINDALLLVKDHSLAAAIAYYYGGFQSVFDNYVKYLLTHQDAAALLDIVHVNSAIVSQAIENWLDIVQKWMQQEKMPNRFSNFDCCLDLLVRCDALMSSSNIESDLWRRLVWVFNLIEQLRRSDRTNNLGVLLKLRVVSKFVEGLSEFHIQQMIVELLEESEASIDNANLIAKYSPAEPMFEAFQERFINARKRLPAVSTASKLSNGSWICEDDESSLREALSALKSRLQLTRQFHFSRHIDWIQSLQSQWTMEQQTPQTETIQGRKTIVPALDFNLVKRKTLSDTVLPSLSTSTLTTSDEASPTISSISVETLSTKSEPALSSANSNAEELSVNSFSNSIVPTPVSSSLGTSQAEPPRAEKVAESPMVSAACPPVPSLPLPAIDLDEVDVELMEDGKMDFDDLNRLLTKDDILKMISAKMSAHELLQLLEGRRAARQIVRKQNTGKSNNQESAGEIISGDECSKVNSDTKPSTLLKIRPESSLWTPLQSERQKFDQKVTNDKRKNILLTSPMLKMSKPQKPVLFVKPLSISHTKHPTVRLFRPLLPKTSRVPKCDNFAFQKQMANVDIQTDRAMTPIRCKDTSSIAVQVCNFDESAIIPAPKVISPSLVPTINQVMKQESFESSAAHCTQIMELPTGAAVVPQPGHGEGDKNEIDRRIHSKLINVQRHENLTETVISEKTPAQSESVTVEYAERSERATTALWPIEAGELKHDFTAVGAKSDTIQEPFTSVDSINEIPCVLTPDYVVDFAREIVLECADVAVALAVKLFNKNVPFSVLLSECVLEQFAEGLHSSAPGEDSHELHHVQEDRSVLPKNCRRPKTLPTNALELQLIASTAVVDPSVVEFNVEKHLEKVRSMFDYEHSGRISGFRSGILSVLVPDALSFTTESNAKIGHHLANKDNLNATEMLTSPDCNSSQIGSDNNEGFLKSSVIQQQFTERQAHSNVYINVDRKAVETESICRIPTTRTSIQASETAEDNQGERMCKESVVEGDEVKLKTRRDDVCNDGNVHKCVIFSPEVAFAQFNEFLSVCDITADPSESVMQSDLPDRVAENHECSYTLSVTDLVVSDHIATSFKETIEQDGRGAVEEVRAEFDQFDDKLANLQNISQRLLKELTLCSINVDQTEDHNFRRHADVVEREIETIENVDLEETRQMLDDLEMRLRKQDERRQRILSEIHLNGF